MAEADVPQDIGDNNQQHQNLSLPVAVAAWRINGLQFQRERVSLRQGYDIQVTGHDERVWQFCQARKLHRAVCKVSQVAARGLPRAAPSGADTTWAATRS